MAPATDLALFRNERGMKINEMTGGRVKNNGNRVDFFFFLFVWYVWCQVIEMSGVEK